MNWWADKWITPLKQFNIEICYDDWWKWKMNHVLSPWLSWLIMFTSLIIFSVFRRPLHRLLTWLVKNTALVWALAMIQRSWYQLGFRRTSSSMLPICWLPWWESVGITALLAPKLNNTINQNIDFFPVVKNTFTSSHIWIFLFFKRTKTHPWLQFMWGWEAVTFSLHLMMNWTVYTVLNRISEVENERYIFKIEFTDHLVWGIWVMTTHHSLKYVQFAQIIHRKSKYCWSVQSKCTSSSG